MLKIFISCDNCGIKEDSDKKEMDYKWLTLSDEEKESHYCSKKCLIDYLREGSE